MDNGVKENRLFVARRASSESGNKKIGSLDFGKAGQAPKRISDSKARPFLFRITSEGRQFLLQEGTDQRYGARHLKRAIERFLVGPRARLLATEQVRSGDALIIDRHPGEKGLAFLKDTELRPASARMPHAASYLTHLATAEV